MFRTNRALLLAMLVALGSSCTGGGCSSPESDDDGSGGGGVDCNACRAGLPVTGSGDVSFTTHLFSDDSNSPGIFRRACNLGTQCHGINPGGKGGLYLGPPIGPISACGADTGAGSCASSADCGGGEQNSCIDPKLACRCGDQQCPSPSQRCVVNPSDGTPVCGPPSDAGTCVTSADCDGGAPGECVDPEPLCVCGSEPCAQPGQRCVETTADANEALKASVVEDLKRASKTFPLMPLVTPNDPANSFLMLKVDGCHACLEVSNCAPGETGNCCSVQAGALSGNATCGDPMPRGAPALPADERDIIRRWIAQGAQNN